VKPLREEFDPTDPNDVVGAALLSRVRPLEESTSRRRRVRIALQTSSPRRIGRFFSPVLVAAVLLVAGTGASATVTRLWKRSHFWQAPEPATRSAIEAAPRAPVAPAAQVVPEATLAANVPLPDIHPVPVVAGKIDVAPPPRVIPRGSSAPKAPPAAVPNPTADPANGPGAALMVEAMQARKAGDQARAAALLSDYQRKYPQGTFQEEALALSIESAAARGSESAPRLASDYLHRYPNGRFRELARRALKSSTR
jgi:hypothetical protein